MSTRSARLLSTPARLGLDGTPLRIQGPSPADRAAGRLSDAREALIAAMIDLPDGTSAHVAAGQAVIAVDEALTRLTGVGQ